MTLRSDLKTDLRTRLGELAASIWTDAELNSYLADATAGLYPIYYQLGTVTSVAGAGPLQTKPAGAVGGDIYYVGLQTTTSNRARVIRGWSDGATQVVVPKLNITGLTLVWAWTNGYTLPSDDITALTSPRQMDELIVMRAQITALERVLTSRVKNRQYFAIQVREGVTEAEIATTLDALHASIDARTKTAIPLPKRIG